MARKNASIELQRERLRVKAAQLDARIKIQDAKDKHKELTARLKSMGGRIR